MIDGRIGEILIIGGGTAGWMAAASLARLLPKGQARVRLIESEEIGTIGVGEATVPLMQIFNGMLGLDEREFICATQGSFKLGIEFVDWGRIGNRHFHCFGDFGEFIDGIAPHHYWMKLRQLGDQTPLEAYCFPTMLAKKNRFAPPTMRGDEPEHYKYAYQFDASLYARYLRTYAERLGVERIEGRIVDVSQQPESGFVEAVTTADGRSFEADLFIDCSGFTGLLIEKTLKTGYEDWSKWLPCDRAVAVPSEHDGPFTPYTRSIAREAGWQWRIPLQHRVGNGYVYSSSFISDDEAASTLLANLEGNRLAEPRLLKFTGGHRRKFWHKNVVALGLASGFLEPLESTSIMLVQTAIARLIEMFPSKDFDPILEQEYNRMSIREYEKVRDFIILHYCLTGRSDSELWRYAAAMDLPDSLRRKMEIFFARGIVPLEGDESFHEPSWVSIFVGQGRLPRRFDPMVDRVDSDRLKAGMRHRRETIDRLTNNLPLHSEFIARSCAAPQVVAA
jgi:tryptophan 7-halogenase